MSTSVKKNLYLTHLFSLLFVSAPFLSQRNMGGMGLSLSYNMPTWAVASWLISAAIAFIAFRKKIVLPRLWIAFCIFPATVTIVSAIAGTTQPTTWLFRELYIIGGLAFLMSLFQFSLKRINVNTVLVFIVFASGIHAFLGTLQTFIPQKELFFWSASTNFSPLGIFQQINVHASFLATGAIITLYLMSCPLFNKRHVVVKSCFILSFGLALYVIAAAGSRVGLFSILLALPLILFSRWRLFSAHKRYLLMLAVVGAFAFFAGSAGLAKTMDKTAQLTSESYANARVTLYTIGAELVAKRPFTGHGIGEFLKVWNKQSSNFSARHPDVIIPPYATHPHNEFLFWAIEGGIFTLISILVAFGAILFALYQCGLQRGGGYAAMLLPISLHTQVEFPFYISAPHWFLWLLLVYLPLSHQVKNYTTQLSYAAGKLLYAVAIILATSTTVFMYNSFIAQADMIKVMLREEPVAKLQLALNNLYFKRKAESTIEISHLYQAIDKKDSGDVQSFEDWGLEYVKNSPDIWMYQPLIAASLFLRPEGKGCDAIQAGLAMYAHNADLKKAVLRCKPLMQPLSGGL